MRRPKIDRRCTPNLARWGSESRLLVAQLSLALVPNSGSAHARLLEVEHAALLVPDTAGKVLLERQAGVRSAAPSADAAAVACTWSCRLACAGIRTQLCTKRRKAVSALLPLEPHAPLEQRLLVLILGALQRKQL